MRKRDRRCRKDTETPNARKSSSRRKSAVRFKDRDGETINMSMDGDTFIFEEE